MDLRLPAVARAAQAAAADPAREGALDPGAGHVGLPEVVGRLAFSRGAQGFWIENGEITYPVQEITLAGNVLKMLKGITMVGNDLSFKLGSVASPTLLISEATIGGA